MMSISPRVLVEECLPFIKPVWSGCMMKGVVFSNLLARALQIIFRSMFSKDIGR